MHKSHWCTLFFILSLDAVIGYFVVHCLDTNGINAGRGPCPRLVISPSLCKCQCIHDMEGHVKWSEVGNRHDR